MGAAARWRRAVGSVLLTAVLLCVIGLLVDPAAGWSTLRAVPASRWIAAGGVSAGLLGLRAARAAVLLPGRVGLLDALAALSLSFLAALVTPLRLGGLLRPALLARSSGVPVAASVVGMVAERVLDAAALALLVAFAGGGVAMTHGRALLPAVGLASGVGLLALLALWRRRRAAVAGWTRALGEALAGLTARPARGGLAVALTSLHWTLAPLGPWLVLSAVEGVPADVSTLASFWAAVSTAVAAVPTPGALGGYEAAGTAALVVAGAPVQAAAAATAALHVVSLAAQALVGTFFLPRMVARGSGPGMDPSERSD